MMIFSSLVAELEHVIGIYGLRDLTLPTSTERKTAGRERDERDNSRWKKNERKEISKRDQGEVERQNRERRMKEGKESVCSTQKQL